MMDSYQTKGGQNHSITVLITHTKYAFKRRKLTLPNTHKQPVFLFPLKEHRLFAA